MTTWKDYLPSLGITEYFYTRKLNRLLGDGDAIILVPYSDGVLIPKRGHYQKHLVGNQSGYTTSDGDVYVADGIGQHVYYFGGVPVCLALNPSEHSAVLDPLKSLIAQKRDRGEFVRVNDGGDVVETGEAVGAKHGDVAVASDDPTDVNYDVYDGLFDLTPPGIVATDDDGGVLTDSDGRPVLADQADGWIISQSKAADLVPSKLSSSEIALMQQRERNAMADASQNMMYAVYGAVGASVLWIVFMVILAIATGNAPSVV